MTHNKIMRLPLQRRRSRCSLSSFVCILSTLISVVVLLSLPAVDAEGAPSQRRQSSLQFKQYQYNNIDERRILRGEQEQLAGGKNQQPANAPSEEETDGVDSEIVFTTSELTTTTTTTPTCPEILGNSIKIDDVSTLYYAIVPSSSDELNNGILCGRLEVLNNDGGWIGLGFSKYGGMIRSTAIIGVPQDEISRAKNTVLKYDLGGYDVGYEYGGWGVYPMIDEKQTLIDTSLYEDETEDGEDEIMVMTFTKLLVEEDELPIVTNGTNIFIHARGYEKRLGHHEMAMSFYKDFAEDIVAVAAEEIVAEDVPSESPSHAPTFTPGTVERYFCTKDQPPLNTEEYCEDAANKDMFFKGFTNFEECNAKCRGGKSCVMAYCITDMPTVSPTSSSVPTPTKAPVSDPSSTPTASPETPSPSVVGLKFTGGSHLPAESKFSFNLPGSGENVTMGTVSLSEFQVDFVAIESEDGPIRGRQLEGQDFLFQTSQDKQLLRLVSDRLYDQFAMSIEGGTPISVELGIDKKSQQDLGSGKVMVSYNYIGYTVYQRLRDDELPTTAELDAQVLNAFNTREGKRAFATSLHASTDDPLLLGIVNVIATSSSSSISTPVSSPDPIKAVDGGNVAPPVIDGTTGNSNGVTVSIVVLVTAILVLVIIVSGLFAFNKYRRYQENNAINDYVNYQNRKKSKKINLFDKTAKKLKMYTNFNSDDSAVSHLELVGGDTYPISQDNSDDDAGSPAKQFIPNDATLPYDEEAAKQNHNTIAAYDMAYFAQAASQMTEEDQSSHAGTLDGLYSDKDSYFQERSILDQHQQAHRLGDSVHSLDTLDQSTLGVQNESISHLIEDIDKIVEKNEQELKKDHDGGPVREEELNQFLTDFVDEVTGYKTPETSMELCVADQVVGHIGVVDEGDYEGEDDSDEEEGGDVISFDGVISRDNYEEEDDEEECSDVISIDGIIATKSEDNYDGDTSEDVISIDGIISRRADGTENAIVLAKVKEDDDTSYGGSDDQRNTSDLSATDQLFLRIAELESKIVNTENQLAQDKNIQLISPPTNSEEAPKDTSKLKGVFTDETLDKIEQSRLVGTPPPSEGDVDTDIVKKAAENSLLGKYLDGSESEDESIFE